MYSNPVGGVGREHGFSLFSGKELTALALVAVLVVGCFVLMNGSDISSADAEPESHGPEQIPGTELEWSYDAGSHKLIISGSGEMPDYALISPSPWYTGYRDYIQAVEIGKDVSKIGTFAFGGLNQLGTITVEDGNTSYKLVEGILYTADGTELVWYPSGTVETEFTVPNGITEIGPYSFCGSKLVTVHIGKDVETIGIWAFSYCRNLTTVDFGIDSKVSSVEDYAFENDTSLETFIFPGSIRTTGSGLFRNSGLQHLEIVSVLSEDETSSIGWMAFADLPNLTYAEIDVTEIGNSAFASHRLETLIIGDHVKVIGQEAFRSLNDRIHTLTIGCGLETIRSAAFFLGGDSTFDTLVLPEGLKLIGQSAFAGIKNLKTLTIPYTVENIESSAFSQLSGLTTLNYNVTDEFHSNGSIVITNPFGFVEGVDYADLTVNIGSSVRTIGTYLFKDCVYIKTLNFAEGVTNIGESSFENVGISELRLPSSLEYLGPTCFRNCADLESVYFSGDISTVTSGIFYKVSEASRAPGKMISAEFGDDVTIIWDFMFDDTLESVTIGKGVQTISGPLPGNNVVTVKYNAERLMNYNRQPLFIIDDEKPAVEMTVTIGNGVEIIGPNVFNGVSNLKHLEMSDSVNQIYSNAFRNTAVGSVVIPAGATVEVFAFGGCISLTSVAVHSGATIALSAFDGISFRDASGQEINGSKLVGFMFAGTNDNMALVKKGFKFDTNCDVVKPDYYGIPGADTTVSEFQVERDYYEFAGWYSDEGLITLADLSKFPDGLVTVYAKWTPVTYNIEYHLNGGEDNDPENPVTYDMDNLPELKPAVRTGYTFKGWSLYPYTLEFKYGGDLYVYAIWEINHYTITFLNYNGTVLQSSEVDYGDTPDYDGEEPTKAADAQYTYTFAGWDSPITSVSGNKAYTATYDTTTNEYTITFLNYDGDELQSISVEYGSTPAYTGETPGKASDVQYTYIFAGWNPEIAAVTGDATYTAVFDPEARLYEITFEAGEGSGTMEKQTKVYGTEYALPECGFTAPDHKEFKCWFVGGGDKEVGSTVTVNADISVTAVWQFVKHTVSFAPGDGTGTMDPAPVVYGDTFILPASTFTAPSGKQFKCWSVGGTEKMTGADITVTGDVAVTALWEDIPAVTYEVSFDANGGSGTMDSVNIAGTYILPTCGFTAPDHKEFKCWSVNGEDKAAGSTITVSADIEIKALWKAETFTVVFVSNGGTEIVSQTVEYGSKAVRPEDPTKSSTVSTDYRFDTWYTEEGFVNAYVFDSSVTANITLYAKWTESARQYTVTFDTNGGSAVSAQTVDYGSKVICPADPTKESTVSEVFAFAGWYSDPGYANAYSFESSVAGNVFLYAKWTSSDREYVIVFADYDGTVLQRNNVAYGSMPEYAGSPEREATAEYTYAFDGWTPAIAAVSGEATYSATYTQTVNSYTVRFVDYDGTTVLQTVPVQYGRTPEYTATTPVRSADAQYTYTFDGWKPAIAVVTSEATYTAKYITVVNSYTVTFDGNGGTETANQTIPYGSKVVVPADPTKGPSTSETYSFAGWYKDEEHTQAYDFDTPVTGNLTIYAGWESQVRSYKVEFKNYDGTVLQSTDILYGTIPSYTGADLVRTASPEYTYSFSGWYPTIVTVIGPATYTAHFDSEAREYTLTFDSAGGTAVGSKVYSFGINIFEPDSPTREGYEFLGWNPSLPDKMPAHDLTVTARWASLPEVSGDTIGFVSDSETVSIDLDSTAVLDAMADSSKTAVSVSGNGWEMEIPKDVLSAVSGAVSVSAQTMSDEVKAALPDSVKERVQGKTVYSLDLSDSNGKITFTGKKITVSLPYTLAAGEKADNVKVFCINGENLEQFDATYDSEKMVAVFQTEHFSDWFVDVVEAPSSGGNGGGFPIWIVAVVIIIAALAAVIVLMKMGIIPDLLSKKQA